MTNCIEKFIYLYEILTFCYLLILYTYIIFFFQLIFLTYLGVSKVCIFIYFNTLKHDIFLLLISFHKNNVPKELFYKVYILNFKNFKTLQFSQYYFINIFHKVKKKNIYDNFATKIYLQFF